MFFTRYADVRAFADEVSDVLGRHESQNNILFHNIQGGLERDDQAQMFMATIKNSDGAILLTAVRTPPYALVFYETDNQPNDEALALLARSLVELDIPIDVFAAEKELAARFCRIYSERAGTVFTISMNLDFYRLERIREISLPAGRFRAAREEDLYFLPYWIADFVPACHLGDYNLEQGYALAEKMVGKSCGYLWEDGIPGAFAANNRNTARCSIIGYVYTPPHLRGKGYGSACVYQLAKQLLADGRKYCALYADCANPYSNRVYQKIGFEHVLFYDEYRLAAV